MKGLSCLYWFDRDEKRLGILHPLGPFVHREILRGDDTLEFYCEETPEKYDRILWRDPQDGRWREHVVIRTEEVLETSGCKVLARTSLCDMAAVYHEETRLAYSEVDTSMATVLSFMYPERWSIECPESMTRLDALLYHTDGYSGLLEIQRDGEVEFEPVIEVNREGVVSRIVKRRRRLGEYRGLQLSYASGLTWCRRTVLDSDIYTRLYGYGKGMPAVDENGNFTGGYLRRLTMEEAYIGQHKVAYGKKYIENDEARRKWGVLVNGEKMHRTGSVMFVDDTTPNQIYTHTLRALEKLIEPRVIYEASAALMAGGIESQLGDRVALIDSTRTPAWKMTTRVVGRTRSFGPDGYESSLQIGNVTPIELASLNAALANVTPVENGAALLEFDEEGCADDAIGDGWPSTS